MQSAIAEYHASKSLFKKLGWRFVTDEEIIELVAEIKHVNADDLKAALEKGES